MSMCMQCSAPEGQSCRHRRYDPAKAWPSQPPNMGLVQKGLNLQRDCSTYRDRMGRELLDDLTHEQRVDLWVAVKRAANALYSLSKDLDTYLLAEAGNSRGFVDGHGYPVEVKRRFETELLDEDEFAAWAADRGFDPFETKVALSKQARDAVKKTVIEDGEKVPGVSAGLGNPFLSLGKVS